MVNSKQLTNKLKITPKISLRTLQAAAATPTTPATEENNEDLLETINDETNQKIIRKK